jgi:hypothetical protein
MRRRSALLLIAVLAAAAGPTAAQAPKAKRYTPPPRPRPIEALASPQTPLPTPPAFAQAGLRSSTDPAPQCRAQCSVVRYGCLAAGDGPDCDAPWITCLRSCAKP